MEVRLASRLVNLTGETIGLYNDADGDIEYFKPRKKRFVSADDREDTFYVIEGIDLEKAKRKFGQNLAIIVSRETGRGGKPIVRLAYAENESILVRLKHNSRKKFAYA